LPVSIFIIAAAAAVAIFIFNALSTGRRRKAMGEAAARLGLRFSPGRDRELARRFKFLDQLRRGANR